MKIPSIHILVASIWLTLFIGQPIGYYSKKRPLSPTEIPEGRVYQVEVGASVTPDKMNVLYIGLDNPITIDIPGVDPEQIKVAISPGSIIRKSSNQFIVHVSKVGEAKIILAADMNGKQTSFSFPFRVRQLPSPIATFGVFESGTHPAKALTAQHGIYCSMGQSFPFEGVKYTVKSYEFVYVPKTGEQLSIQAIGYQFPEQAQSIMANVKSGDCILIRNIESIGPDGKRTASPIVIVIE